MADVFVSYASEDRETARRLSQILTQHGWTVWWDRTIPPGRAFDEVIQEGLTAAKSVVVLWSAASIGSDWVKSEAADAAERRILVPALIGDVAPPFEFRRTQAANLSGWDGDPDHPELATLLASVERLVTAPTGAPPAAPRAGTDAASRRSTRSGVLAGGAFVLAALIGGGVWLARRSPASEPARVVPGGTAAATVTTEPPGTPAPAPNARPVAPPTSVQRTNLLAPKNGGQVVAASTAEWALLIDGQEEAGVWIDGGEGVFAFKDDRPATFDTFAVFVPGSDKTNLKSFELLGGDDSPTGSFTSIGTFATQNTRLFKSPYQEFHFPPVTARFLKFRSLGSHAGNTGAVRAYEFQLFGDLQ